MIITVEVAMASTVNHLKIYFLRGSGLPDEKATKYIKLI